MEYVSYALDHAGFVFALLAAIHGVAVVIVNATETPADDAVVAKVYSAIELVAGIVTARAKS